MGTPSKALTMSFSFSLSASIALVLLFFPKLYIILLHPEKNVRSSYATTKLIRCHFGNSSGLDSKHNLSSKTRNSFQSSSVRLGSYSKASYHSLRLLFSFSNARTASVHVPTSHGNTAEVSTQTDSGARALPFLRTLSVMGPRRRNLVDEDVMRLIDSCRRYQVLYSFPIPDRLPDSG